MMQNSVDLSSARVCICRYNTASDVVNSTKILVCDIQNLETYINYPLPKHWNLLIFPFQIFFFFCLFPFFQTLYVGFISLTTEIF